MLTIQNLKYVGAMNPAGFIAVANDLGAEVENIHDAAVFFIQFSETDGEAAVINQLANVPVSNKPGGFKSTAPGGTPYKSVWENLGDAVVSLFGGSTAEQTALLEQNNLLQQQLNQQMQEQQNQLNMQDIIVGAVALTALGIGAYFVVKLID